MKWKAIKNYPDYEININGDIRRKEKVTDKVYKSKNGGDVKYYKKRPARIVKRESKNVIVLRLNKAIFRENVQRLLSIHFD